MPPRKRYKASAVSSGAQTTAVAGAYQDLPKLQKDVVTLVENMFSLRHARQSDIHDTPKGLLVPENGLYPYPITWGGTFMEIAQKAWDEPDKLVRMSAELAYNAGMMDACDDDEFVQQFCKMDVSRICCFFGFTLGRKGLDEHSVN